MEIVIAHLTRMQSGYICVAGIDTATGKQIRPCLQHGQRIDRALFDQHVFDMANVVDLGPCRCAGHPPEVEDHIFSPRLVKPVRRENADTFWARLFEAAETSLVRVFGPDLTLEKPRATVAANHGTASLGLLFPVRKPRLCIENMYGKPTIRLHVYEQDTYLNLSVTDLRLYEPDQATIRVADVESLASRMQRGTPVILSIGLTRLFQKDHDSQPLHYLQVNNIHLEDNPVWTNA